MYKIWLMIGVCFIITALGLFMTSELYEQEHNLDSTKQQSDIISAMFDSMIGSFIVTNNDFSGKQCIMCPDGYKTADSGMLPGSSEPPSETLGYNQDSKKWETH